MPQLVVTAVGPDRPGLVGQFTSPILEAGANVADSRMVNLRGQFALLVLVDGSDAALEKVRRTLPAAGERAGLAVTFAVESTAGARHGGMPFRIKTFSVDQPGIVHRVSSLLHEHGVNIEDLSTHVESAPFDGSALFSMELHVTVPAKVKVRALREALDALASTLNCDLDLEPA